MRLDNCKMRSYLYSPLAGRAEYLLYPTNARTRSLRQNKVTQEPGSTSIFRAGGQSFLHIAGLIMSHYYYYYYY